MVWIVTAGREGYLFGRQSVWAEAGVFFLICGSLDAGVAAGTDVRVTHVLLSAFSTSHELSSLPWGLG